MTELQISRFAGRDELIDAAALRFIDVVTQAQAGGDGMARVVLTGGGAGLGLLTRLRELHEAAQAQAEDFPALSVDWTRVHVYFGDERNVAVGNPESNEGQARAALLEPVGIPEDHIHGYGLDGGSLAEAAARYEELLPESFDLHLLGMGGEGHINSLFPHTSAVAETEKLVVAVYDSPKPPAERISLTLPAVQRADNIWLLVAGAEKATAAQHVISGADANEWPAAGAQATELFLAV